MGADHNPLWKRKLSEKLGKLLQTRALLLEAKSIKIPYKIAALLLNSEKNKGIVNFVLGELRTIATASRVADLNVCGPIPPYNNLMGGKLVALAATTREIQKLYADRYASSVSKISSFIAGKRVLRPTNLEVITTTSLYGAQSIQCNGLKLLKSKFPELKHDVVWEKLGVTKGKGTFHFSNSTTK